jgi:hypothetical protein
MKKVLAIANGGPAPDRETTRTMIVQAVPRVNSVVQITSMAPNARV